MNKHLSYADYVVKHKWYVFQECLKRGLLWRGIKHDWTKFLPHEWVPYVEYFYGELKDDLEIIGHAWLWDELIQEPFDRAWNAHAKHNTHHWQYHILIKDTGEITPLDMSEADRKEMLADWIGAGKAQGHSDVWNWYWGRKDRILLHPDTREWIESELNDLEDGYEEQGLLWKLRHGLLAIFGFTLVSLMAAGYGMFVKTPTGGKRSGSRKAARQE